MLEIKHGFSAEMQAEYAAKTLERFRNQARLNDDVVRVGRQPLRKISRNERLIAPAAYLAEHGKTPEFLLRAVGSALAFESVDDPEVAELGAKLAALSAQDFAAQVCGIEAGHPLSNALTSVIAAAQV
jgi:mannitol-1-phosphate 5-dehydrogenase